MCRRIQGNRGGVFAYLVEGGVGVSDTFYQMRENETNMTESRRSSVSKSSCCTSLLRRFASDVALIHFIGRVSAGTQSVHRVRHVARLGEDRRAGTNADKYKVNNWELQRQPSPSL